MTNDASLEAAGDAAGGPLSAAPLSEEDLHEAPAARRSIFDLRAVAPLSPQERAARAAAMERSLAFGAEPVRDERGWAPEVDFIEANGAAVEPWKHDRRDKTLYKRNQKVTKAAGQLIGQPGDKIEWAKRLAVLHHREGSDIEGAVRRGLFDAIWRYDHVYDGYTVPRRYGTHFMKTGRVAAVAEEQRRKWIAEGRAPADAFWVRNRRNTGLVLVSPNPDPDAPVEVSAEVSDEIFGKGGVEAVTGQADIERAFEPYFPEEANLVPAEVLGLVPSEDHQVRVRYPDIPLAPDPSKTRPAGTPETDSSKPPVINFSKDRITNILADEPAVFEIIDSAKAVGDEPDYANHFIGFQAVQVYQDAVELKAKRQGVDPRLVKAVMYLENANGATYGPIVETLGVARSLLPMNIRPKFWAQLAGRGGDLSDPLQNIGAGVVLLRRIIDRVQQPSVAKVGTLYNSLAKERVTEFGARLAQVYESQEWEKIPERFTSTNLDKDPLAQDMLAEIRRNRRRILESLPTY